MKVIDDIGQIYDPTKVNEDKNIDTLIKELELKMGIILHHPIVDALWERLIK